MAIEINIPKLGMTMTKARVAKWKFSEGEYVKEKQIVLVIETEKVTFEVEAPGSGFLHIIVTSGKDAEVAEVVGLLAETEAELATLGSKPVTAAGKAAADTAAPVTPAKTAEPPKFASRADRVKISPRAKKIALANKLDISTIIGTGLDGRIMEKDIEQALATQCSTPSAAQTSVSAQAFSGEVLDGKRVKKSVSLQGMRKAISDHMVHSLQVSAQLTAGTEVDMTEIIRFRNSQKQRPEFRDISLSFTDIFVYMIAKILKEQPLMNSSLIDGKIVMWEDVNVGIAVSTMISAEESGLVVPVIKNADKMTLSQITRASKQLIDKARQGKLGIDEMTGGTFTLTNTGSFGARWHWATPVLNQPQVGILQTAATVDRVVPVNGVPVIKPMMPMVLTFDHRVLDGFGAAQFMVRLAELLEDPYRLVD